MKREKSVSTIKPAKVSLPEKQKINIHMCGGLGACSYDAAAGRGTHNLQSGAITAKHASRTVLSVWVVSAQVRSGNAETAQPVLKLTAALGESSQQNPCVSLSEHFSAFLRISEMSPSPSSPISATRPMTPKSPMIPITHESLNCQIPITQHDQKDHALSKRIHKLVLFEKFRVIGMHCCQSVLCCTADQCCCRCSACCRCVRCDARYPRYADSLHTRSPLQRPKCARSLSRFPLSSATHRPAGRSPYRSLPSLTQP